MATMDLSFSIVVAEAEVDAGVSRFWRFLCSATVYAL